MHTKPPFNDSPPRFRVALVAAARNEAAYLADWLHHHLYFGFGPIEVAVNRSDDGSGELVQRVAAHNPLVRLVDGDQFDAPPGRRGNLQLAAYDAARVRLRRELGRADYVMCADIDELWTPTDFSSTVQRVLAGAGYPRVAAFNWFQQVHDTPPFAAPFSGAIYGHHHHLVKSAFRARLRILSQSVHSVRPLRPGPVHAAGGAPVSWWQPYRSAVPPQDFGAAFMLHRLFRSPVEYLAILGRGRPAFPADAIKTNRFGYNLIEGEAQPLRQFAAPASAAAAYHTSRSAFLQSANAEEQREPAHRQVRERAAQVLRLYRDAPDTLRKKWAMAFANLDLDTLERDLLGSGN